MPNAIFVGDLSPFQQGWEVEWSPTNGGSSSLKYMGMDADSMLNLALQNAAAGVTCKVSYSKNIAELILTSSDPALQGFGSGFSNIVDRWEVGVDAEQPELFENSNFLSLFDGVNSTYGTNVDQQFFQVIKTTSENDAAINSKWALLAKAPAGSDKGGALYTTNLTNLDGTSAGVTLGSLIASLSTPTWGGLSPQATLQFFAQEYFRGRTNFAHGKYVLKHTTMAPCNYSQSVAEFNIEKIYSISQLLSEVQSATLWILPLPAYLAYKILGYPVPVNMPPGYTWGALKMRSNAILSAKGRIEITQEYLIDAIAVPTYGLK